MIDRKGKVEVNVKRTPTEMRESKAGFSPAGCYPRNVLQQVIPQVYKTGLWHTQKTDL